MLWYFNNVIRQRMRIEIFNFSFLRLGRMPPACGCGLKHYLSLVGFQTKEKDAPQCIFFFFPPVISPNPKDLSSFWDKLSGTYRADSSS